MKRSDKILNNADIPKNLSEYQRMTIENNVLLKHIIDNELKHIWGWIKGIAIAVFTLVFRFMVSFFGK